jgi:hypothetical protein
MEWQATWFVARNSRGVAQVHETTKGKWLATVSLWGPTLPSYTKYDLGDDYASAQEAMAACDRRMSGEAVCGPVNVDADGREVSP